jgi:hypothetical protein
MNKGALRPPDEHPRTYQLEPKTASSIEGKPDGVPVFPDAPLYSQGVLLALNVGGDINEVDRA